MNQHEREMQERKEREAQQKRKDQAGTIGGVVIVVLILLIMMGTGETNLMIVGGFLALILIPIFLISGVLTKIIETLGRKDDN